MKRLIALVSTKHKTPDQIHQALSKKLDAFLNQPGVIDETVPGRSTQITGYPRAKSKKLDQKQ